MSSQRDPGPFLKSEFIPEKRIQRIVLEQLQATKLLPATPSPVAVDKFSDRKWGMAEDYENLPDDVLGCAMFTINGIDRIVINSKLDEDTSLTGRQRVRSTIAHEIGHAILHEKMFIEKMMFDRNQRLLFGELDRNTQPPTRERIVCREPDVFGGKGKSPWWEIQANKFMAEMLMPRPLFLQVVEPLLANYEFEEFRSINRFFQRERAIGAVSKTFNVSNQMAKIAVENYLRQVRPKTEEGALL